MQLDTRLPLMAAQQPAMQFQPETRLESLGKIAPAINAMRQMQSGQQEEAEALRKRQAYQEFQSEVTKAFPGGVQELARVFMTKGTKPEHFEVGLKLMQASQEEARNRRMFGPSEGEAPMGAMPAQTPAAAAPAFIQAPVSQVAPEMFYGAGGGRPANALMQMEAPAAAMPAAQGGAPQGYTFAGRTYSAPAVQEMLTRQDTRPLGMEIVKTGQPKQDEVASRMRMMGLDPSKQSDWSSYYRITQPGAVINEQRLELDRQRSDLESKRFALSQAKNQQELQMAQRNLALSERRMDLATRQFEIANNPEFQARLAGAKEAAQIAAKDDSAALQQAPSAIEAGQRTLELLNRMVGDPKGKGDATKPHPGFTGVVGATLTPGMRLVSGTPEADFDKMLEQVLGGAFLEAYERLKGTGQITEIEGQKATQAITRMGRAVSEQEFLQAAGEFRNAVETAINRTQGRLSRAQGRTAPAPATTPVGANVTAAPLPVGNRTFPPPPQAAIDALKRGQGTDVQFDAIFGPGSAARARGR